MTDEHKTQVDQYDSVLRAMEEGLLIGLNNSVDSALPLGESEVLWSHDDKTKVELRYSHDTHYRIHRHRNGDLVYSEVTEDGLSYEDEVLSIEVSGIHG